MEGQSDEESEEKQTAGERQHYRDDQYDRKSRIDRN
jgi:hypothetical protein